MPHQFSSISFDPNDTTLTIKKPDGSTLGCYDLTQTGVKLSVTKPNGQFEVTIETATPSSLSGNYATQLTFEAQDEYAKLFFEVPTSNNKVTIGSNIIEIKQEFTVAIIGVDDLRNNRTSSGHFESLEGNILSFAIENDRLDVRYHDSISENV